MKIYKVGGAVRDFMMNRIPKDIDYVVVGATPHDMISRGFVQVGADFPVFLKDDCEYALARIERKIGHGYKGFKTDFDVSVTLEEDLCRRDLTINSMAMDEDGTIIDYYGGQEDIKNKVLRHVSSSFAEDPLRVLRVARFAARYSDFTIAEETKQLMKDIVKSNELQYLSKERIFTEFEKAFSEEAPEKFIEILMRVGALQAIHPLFQIITEHFLKNVAVQFKKLSNSRDKISYFLLYFFIERDIKNICENLKFPNDIRDTALNYIMYECYFTTSPMSAISVLDYFKVEHDIFNFNKIIILYNRVNDHKRDIRKILKMVRDYRSVSFATLSDHDKQLKGKAISEAIKQRRIDLFTQKYFNNKDN